MRSPCVALAAAAWLWAGQTGAAELIRQQEWAQATSAVSVLQLPAMQRVAQRFESGPDMVVSIRYPGGDDGNRWAIELRDWLVSLGIGLDRIELLPGSGVPGAIAVVVEPRGAL